MPAYARAVSGLSGNGVGAHFTSVPAGDLDPSCSTTPGASDSCGGMESEWGLYDKLIKNPGEIQAVMAQGVDDGAYVNESYNGVNTFFSFDSYDSAATKAQYARNNGLGGVFFWTLSTASPVKTASGELNQNSMLNGVHMVYMG
ncbi:MAG: hypothetical protein EBX40_03000 [Gammaproteobacteria bacterium]|nr:hypothetical protein [Gammaproteobacteria bacterium]